MTASQIRRIVHVAVRILRDKKKRRILFAVLFTSIFLLVMIPLVTAQIAVSALSGILTGICDFLGIGGYEFAEDYLTCEQMMEAFENGYTFDESTETSLRMRKEDFVYMLERVHEYNTAGERTRTITIEGERTRITEVPVPDENGDQQFDTEGNLITEEEELLDHPTMEVKIDNSIFEGMDYLDYRILFYTCMLAASDRKNSNRVLASVKPLDKDFREITATGGGREIGGYMVTREDIDRCFTYLTMSFQYEADLLREEKGFYSFSECRKLPHTESREAGEDGSETVYYIPCSYLRSAKGKFSEIELTKDSSGRHLLSVKAVYRHDLPKAMEALFPALTWNHYKTVFRKIPGGEMLLGRFDEWARTGHTYKEVRGLNIEYSGALFHTFAGNSVIGDYFDSIGEAAVAWALSVSCHGETTRETAWTYDQHSREDDGHTDCSSLIYRAYKESGLEWPEELTWATTVSFYSYFTSHPECILVDRCTDFVNMPSGMMIGDVIMRPQADGYWNPEGNNHILLYAGKNAAGEDMVVHGSSSAGHVHTQTLSSIMSSMSRYGWYSVFRPYAGLTYSFNEAGGLTAKDLLMLLDGTGESENDREQNAAEVFLYYALIDSRVSGIIPSVTAAQAMLESGIGTNDWQSAIATNENNLFGMKRDLSVDAEGNPTWISTAWGGEWRNYWTVEQDEEGNEYEVEVPFREYSCISQSFTDHHEYLLQAKKGNKLRYAGIDSEKDYRKALQILVNGGYSTDTEYVSKLSDLIERLDLSRYDTGFMSAEMPLPAVLSGYMRTNGRSVVKAGTETISWNPSWEFADRITQKNIKPVTRYIPENYNGHTVFVNAGHGGGQSLGSSTQNDPYGEMTNQYAQGGGVSAYSASKGYTSGAAYVYGGVSYPESAWTMEIAGLLKDELLSRGYGVVMAREKEELSNENAVRSIFANATADIHVAIHFNSGGAEGVGYYRPDRNLSGHRNWQIYAAKAAELGECLENCIAESIGCKKTNGCVGNLTGYMYSTIPCVYVESANNTQADDLHNRKHLFAEGYANGIDLYFANHPGDGKFRFLSD